MQRICSHFVKLLTGFIAGAILISLPSYSVIAAAKNTPVQIHGSASLNEETITWGGTGDDTGISTAVDGSGNIYVSGYFNGSVDFNPGGGFDSHTSNGGRDIFLSKFDSNGNFLWAKTWGGSGDDRGESAAVDGLGNVYVAGPFRSIVDFDPGSGVDWHTAPGGIADNDAFLSKFDANGNFLWARTWGGIYGDEAYCVTLDGSGNAYVVGDFSSPTVDFNPGTGVDNHAMHGFFDAFLTKFDSNGNFIWAKTWGGEGYDDSPGVAIDSLGNVYAAGMYGSTDPNLNFDPAGGSGGLGHQAHDSGSIVDVFLSKFDSNGNFQWVRTWGAQGNDDVGQNVIVDGENNVYVGGRFGCSDYAVNCTPRPCNFNPGVGTDNHTSNGLLDAFVSKFDSSGTFQWVKTWGGTGVDAESGLAADSSNNVYVAGVFTNSVDFGSGSGVSSNGLLDASLSKFGTNGIFQWVKTWGGTGNDGNNKVTRDMAGNVYVAGWFNGAVDFDLGGGVDNHTAIGGSDAFLSIFNATLTNNKTLTAGRAIASWQSGIPEGEKRPVAVFLPGWGGLGAVNASISAQNTNLVNQGYVTLAIGFDTSAEWISDIDVKTLQGLNKLCADAEIPANCNAIILDGESYGGAQNYWVMEYLRDNGYAGKALGFVSEDAGYAAPGDLINPITGAFTRTGLADTVSYSVSMIENLGDTTFPVDECTWGNCGVRVLSNAHLVRGDANVFSMCPAGGNHGTRGFVNWDAWVISAIKTMIHITSGIPTFAGYNAPALTVSNDCVNAAILPGLSVSGINIIANGQPIRLRGINMGDPFWARNPSWYPMYSTADYANIAQNWNANVVRISIFPTQWIHMDQAVLLAGLAQEVNAALDSGMYVIISYHVIGWPNGWYQPACCGNSADTYDSSMDDAASFWTQMALTYGSDKRIIFDLWNEPVHDASDWNDVTYWTELKPFYEALITTVRNKGAQNIVIATGAGWASWLGGIKDNPLADANIVYAYHKYSVNGSNTAAEWDKDTGGLIGVKPVIVSEWGYEDTDVTNPTWPGSQSSFGYPFTQWMEHNNLSSLAWMYHHNWTPALLKSDGSLTLYGTFVKQYLDLKLYPIVASIVRANPGLSSAASVNFVVTFSESVTGVNIIAPFDDFTLTTSSGINGASITGVSGSGKTYTVTVKTGTGNGTIRLDVIDDDSIVAGGGSKLGGTGAGNGNFTSGEAYDIVKDSSGFNPPWYGSVSITANKNVVAVGRPHIGSEVASYSGFSAGALTAYVPMLFKNAYDGTYDSALYIQNVDASVTANVTIKYYDSTTGILTCTDTETIKPLASKGYWLPTLSATECTGGTGSGLPVGWVGSAVVTSTTAKIVAIGRPHIGAEVMTYDSFPSGSLTSYLPMLFNGSYGGGYNSAFYIQNVSTYATAAVTIKYYDSDTGALTCTDTASIAPNTSTGYWLPTLSATECLPSGLPTGWVGGVVVTSSAAPIVTVGRPHVGTQITTYNGFAAGGLSSYVPMLFRKAYGGTYDSALYIQNVGAVDAAITIKYYDSAGALTCTATDTIKPLSSKGYWLPTISAAECTGGTGGGLPDDWVGGAVVTSSTAKIVAIGRPHIGAQVTTYNGFTSGNSNSYLPMLFKNIWGYDSAFYIQNTDAAGPAAVTVKFYDADGNLSCIRSDSIPALSTLGYWTPSVICE